jgi:hypothetical protein
MKKYPFIGIVLFFLTGFFVPARSVAQRNACPMSDNGSWQLVTNDRKPRSVIVKFYDLQGRLLYQERVMDRDINFHKKRICRVLNNNLQAALVAYNASKRL